MSDRAVGTLIPVGLGLFEPLGTGLAYGTREKGSPAPQDQNTDHDDRQRGSAKIPRYVEGGDQEEPPQGRRDQDLPTQVHELVVPEAGKGRP